MEFFRLGAACHLTLCCISLTSIIGTVVPQGETSAEYVRRFGEKTALFFHILDIPRMYSSWWFHGLLALLAVNLIVCSLDRFPAAWKLINADNLDISPSRLEKMPLSRRWTVSTGLLETIDWHRALSRSGGALEKKEENRMLLLAEKGKWSRLGVYLVHASILIIFVGAIVGQLWGFKGSVMLPELRETGHVFSVGNSDRIPLGFTVRCQAFAIDYYDNGMVREYRSTLTILEDQKEVLTTDIIVNSPLGVQGHYLLPVKLPTPPGVHRGNPRSRRQGPPTFRPALPAGRCLGGARAALWHPQCRGFRAEVGARQALVQSWGG
jgi:cytochrome c biogenesis protein